MDNQPTPTDREDILACFSNAGTRAEAEARAKLQDISTEEAKAIKSGLCDVVAGRTTPLNEVRARLPLSEEPQTRADKIRLFQMNRGDFESACRTMGLEPLDFATWLVVHYKASQFPAPEPEEPLQDGSYIDKFGDRRWIGTGAPYKVPTPARVEQPASEGSGASRACPICKIHGIIVHGDREVCTASWCNYFKMYPHGFVGNKELCGKLGCGKLASHDIHAAPTPPATGEAANLLLSPGENLPIKGSIYEQYPKPAPVGDVEQAELPPLPHKPRQSKYWDNGIEWDVAGERATRMLREDQLRAEIAAHKATRKQLLQTHENLVIVRMQDYAELSTPEAAYKLYSLWQDALHKPHSAHPENRRIVELEAENQELRRKVEELEKLLSEM